jgi:hypothetical protein
LKRDDFVGGALVFLLLSFRGGRRFRDVDSVFAGARAGLVVLLFFFRWFFSSPKAPMRLWPQELDGGNLVRCLVQIQVPKINGWGNKNSRMDRQFKFQQSGCWFIG